MPEDTPGRAVVAGAAWLGRKRAPAALDHLLRAVGENDDPATRMLLGRAYLLAADPGAAAMVFEDLHERASDLPGLTEALACAYRSDARYADAIRLAGEAMAPGNDLLYEKAMSQACLGDAEGSLASWDALIGRVPDRAAAWYGSHAPALDLLGWPEAERRLHRAAACPKANGKYQAMLAAYDLLAGRSPRPCSRKHAYVADSAAALLPHLDAGVRLFGMAPALLAWAVGEARRPGLVLEFGVRRGTSLTAIARAAGQEAHGFDSFEGLPEAWGSAPRGVLSTGREMPAMPPCVTLHPGWFEDTLPVFLATHDGFVRFANIDSDIYSSARTVLTALAGRIGPGTVLVFDEFIGNRTWRDDEFRAFHEYAEARGVRWRVIAVNLACKQVALTICE
ncbi:hypothetical protein CWS72_08460 [Telmatospirillum siberiense]|uniref:Macrocin O-methyltransferase n=2 Tax=Telmatospirillum siberiense TaxID=382514 RepID=A0A2N3PX94_9PROT|nr:hypothetical protein CWS72_08460 [Telmatospirillum siberiense]